MGEDATAWEDFAATFLKASAPLPFLLFKMGEAEEGGGLTLTLTRNML
jgi:hypothetical protein